MSRNYWFGVGAILLASFLWGGGYFLRKIILGDIHPISLNFAVCFLAVIFLFVFFRLNVKNIYFSFLRHPWQFLSLAFFGVVLGSSSLLFGLARLDLGITTILEKMQPVITVLLAWFFLRERISGSSGIFMLLAIVASYFVSAKSWGNFSLEIFDLLGVGFVLLAAFSWAVASVISKKMRDNDLGAKEMAFLRFFLGFLMLVPLLFFVDDFSVANFWDVKIGGIVVLVAFFSTVLGYVFYYCGLKYVTAGVAGFLELLTPVTSLALGILFLGESFVFSQILGVFLLMVSVYCIVRKN